MTKAGILDRGREAYTRCGWGDAYAHLSAADREAPLGPFDLENLATAAYLTGRDDESIDILARAHQAFLGTGDTTRAARSAFWLASALIYRGDLARGGGWIARARRLLDEARHDCVERGYLLLPVALQSVADGDIVRAEATFAEAVAIGDRFGDADLVNLARQGHGRALIGLGETAGGVALLDEVMVAVTTGELSPRIAGIIYCSVISACFDMFDLRRAQEWTDALHRWCAAQPDLVPYRGHCLVHRTEILRLHGGWPDALDEAQRACERLGDPPGQPAVGSAFYQLGEIRRLRGEFSKAEDAYRQASASGRTPHPGLALLWLAQGRIDVAKAAVCRVMDEVRDRRTRSTLLSACVEILLASDDVPAARRAAEELSAIATTLGTPYLQALSAQAGGAVALAEGNPMAALTSLRRAWTTWRDIEVPYEAARVSVLIGLACRALGDADSGQMELDAARRVFVQLGAAPDAARVDALYGTAATRAAGGLTAREVQVLRLVASGMTNRAIAGELSISEKTVARHMSNIFTKLDLSSRAAATAYAFQHQLV